MILVGTSGYNYPEWKGSFYPSDLPAAKMLPYYASKFPTVEINYTFYRMPTPKIDRRLARAGAAGVPLHAEGAEAHHARQAPARRRRRRIGGGVHDRARRNSARSWPRCCFSCRRTSRRISACSNEFLALLPPKTTAAFEFRNASWLDDEVFDALRARNIALCIADSETRETPVVPTADYAYLRLRDEGYGDADIAQWTADREAAGATASDVFVYFKHEDEGKGAAFGQQMMELLDRPHDDFRSQISDCDRL